MKHANIIKNVLHQLGIGKSYNGYDYILYGMQLIEIDDGCLNNITKILYIDIAKKFYTSPSCVEKNIRKVIEVIWKHLSENEILIQKIFGSKYITRKPTNKEFFELLYEYAKSYDVLEYLLNTDKLICPISQDVCIAYHEIIEKLILLKQ